MRQKSIEEILCMLLALFLVVSLVLGSLSLFKYLVTIPTKFEQTKASYEAAVLHCGKDNIHQNDYTNGTSDFTCVDYSKVK